MILFRCNAGPSIGFGHLVRCRSLAVALKEQGESCVMVGPPEEYQTPADREVFSGWYPQGTWKSASDDARWLVELVHHYSGSMMVLDDYRVDEEYQGVLREAGMHWLQFDGRANRPLWADIVLNTSPGARVKEYQSVLRTDATLLFGPEYALLRPEFKSLKLRSADRPVERVLVTFGGGDDRGANEFVLKTLVPATPKAIRFLVISGATNPQNPEIAAWIKNHGQGRVTLKVNPSFIAPLIASCDIAVMAGGTTVYEVASCGLPMILVGIADNQIKHSLAWEQTGAARYLGMLDGVAQETLIDAFNTFKDARLIRECTEESDQRFVDALGAERIARHLISKSRVQI